MAINQPSNHCVNLRRQVFLNFNVEPWKEPIVASLSPLHNYFHPLCRLSRPISRISQ